MRRRLFRLFPLFPALLLSLVAAAPAFAHAMLKSAAPAADATVAGSPAELKLTFNEPLEHAYCTVKLAKADGAAVALGAPHAIDGDADSMAVPVPAPLAAGSYEVRWSAMGRDGHRTQGRYRFTVK